MPKAPPELIQVNTRRQVHLERNKTHEEKAYLPFLELMRDDIESLLDGDITALNRRQLDSQLKGLRKAIAEHQLDYKDVWIQQIKDVAQSDILFESNAMNTVTDLDFKLPAPRQMESAIFTRPLSVSGIHGGKLLDTFFTDVLESDVNRISNIIRLGYAQGQTTGQITKTVIGTAKNRFKDGTLDTFKRSAKMLVRTGLHHSSQMSRQSLYEANRRVIKGLQWTSTLDSRTTVQCQALDGQIFPIDSGPRPPIHIGCRSTMTPEFDSRFAFLKEGATRSSRGPDGVKPTDAKQTYYSWLKTQNVDFQDSAIGAKWGKLMRDGGLSSGRFAELRLNNNFEPATLLDIEKLEPLALQKAGMTVNDAGNIADI